MQFHSVDLDAPFVGCFIEDGAQLHVDGVTRCQTFVKFQFPNDIAERSLGQFLNRVREVVDLVNGFDRVGDLKVDEGIDLGHDVVLGDDALFREIKNGFAQVHPVFQLELNDFLTVWSFSNDAPSNLPWPVDDGDDDVDACREGCTVFAQTFNDHGFALAYDAHAFDDDDSREQKKESS